MLLRPLAWSLLLVSFLALVWLGTGACLPLLHEGLDTPGPLRPVSGAEALLPEPRPYILGLLGLGSIALWKAVRRKKEPPSGAEDGA